MSFREPVHYLEVVDIPPSNFKERLVIFYRKFKALLKELK